MPAGRPTDYKDEYAKLAYNYCLLGATDKDLAQLFGVQESSVNNWKIKHREFLEALKAGKEAADARVASSLFHRALGYYHDEDKIFNADGVPLIVPTKKYYPPDTTACIFWLKNRQKDKWRDKTEQDVTINDISEDLKKARERAKQSKKQD